MNAQTTSKIWYAPHEFQSYGDEEIQAVVECLKKGRVAPGKYTEEFEQKIAKYFGKNFGLMCNSGSSANLLALSAAEIGSGDEVIVCACTFATNLAPIIQRGATPVFVDVNVQTFVPDVDSVINAITQKTKAIFLANLAGSKPDWEAIRKRTTPQILLIEDSCDTMTYTPITDITTTSFYASHIINALSSAGMVMFNNEKMYKRALCHRDWGRRAETNTEVMGDRFSHSIDGIFYDHKFLYDYVGYNMKSNEACAAFGLVQLEKLPTFLKRRRENMALYAKRLKAFFELPKDWELYDWIALPLLHKNRREIMEFLEANNVQTRVFFSGNITRHPAYRQYLQAFEGADRVMKEGFLIGCHHGMTLEDVNRVCDLLILYDMQHTQTVKQWIEERTITYI